MTHVVTDPCTGCQGVDCVGVRDQVQNKMVPLDERADNDE